MNHIERTVCIEFIVFKMSYIKKRKGLGNCYSSVAVNFVWTIYRIISFLFKGTMNLMDIFMLLMFHVALECLFFLLIRQTVNLGIEST